MENEKNIFSNVNFIIKIRPNGEINVSKGHGRI